MINVANITKSLETTFKNSAGLGSFGFTPASIQRGDYVNSNPNACPWLGIYRTRVDYNPRTLGNHAQAWDGTVTIRLMVQASHLDSGATCEDLLEGYIEEVLTEVWKDPTWVNTVDMVTSMDVAYSYRDSDTETIYYQWALITITAEVSTG